MVDLPTSDASPRSGRRKYAFRALTVVLALLPLVLLELTLILFDVAESSLYRDPLVGFNTIHPLFVPSEDGARYEIPESRQVFFRPESFSMKKEPGEFRIFCLGGSTVQGRPFAIETSFTTWLELSLASADQSQAWDVVNCGGVSYASYRLVPILEEVLHHQADLVILYTGQNEFLESRTYDHIKNRPIILARPLEFAYQLRTVTLARQAADFFSPADAASEPTLNDEVEALLDYRGGLEHYHRDPEWRSGVIKHFHYNVRRMIDLCNDAVVPIVLVNPVCNLRNSPPFKSLPGAGLTEEETKRFSHLWEQARQSYSVNKYQAAQHIEQAIAIDDEHAGIYFDLANCYEAIGQKEKARAAYVRSKELDICPLRILEPMHQSLLEIADRTGTPLVDVARLFDTLSRNGIPGSDWLVDHVHPTINGHKEIAELLLEKLTQLGHVAPQDNWTAQRDRRYQSHTESLDDLYFAKGAQRLEGLRGWAQGRATKMRKATGDKTTETTAEPNSS